MNRRPSLMPPPSSRASMAPAAASQSSKQAMAAELERTEQSITIALQEIDKNFARANRVVGEKILPVIERYSQQSRTLWSGAEFWKQFLESAANVKLSGYEEDMHQDTEVNNNNKQEEEGQEVGGLDTLESMQFDSEVVPLKHDTLDYSEENEDTEFDENFTPEIQSTPHHQQQRRSSSPTKIPKPMATTPKMTPRKEPSFDDDDDFSLETPVKKEPTPKSVKKSVLRHQVLDKTWGIQATPMGKKGFDLDNEFSLSPDLQPPKSSLLSNDSIKQEYQDDEKEESFVAAITPQKPRQPFTPLKNQVPRELQDDSDVEMEMEMGMSPPVTMHFGGPNLVKQDLVKTPARQAAKTIVDDILRDVGDESESINASITKTHYPADYLLDDDSF